MQTGVINHINSAKRNCMLCHTYRNLKPTTDQKELAQNSTKKAYNTLRIVFEDFRNKDADIKQIESVKTVKSLCLDALDACNNCDKQRPKIKEIFINIK